VVQYHLDPLACGAVNELADRVRLRVGGLQGVGDLDATVDELRRAGVDFGGDMITGMGGRQALALDPSGNLVQLIEAYQR
jgi:predicted enzyme related to lactoylglutathione lyase